MACPLIAPFPHNSGCLVDLKRRASGDEDALERLGEHADPNIRNLQRIEAGDTSILITAVARLRVGSFWACLEKLDINSGGFDVV
jgi:hypothetical protein